MSRPNVDGVLGIEALARSASADPEVLRLENVDTDIMPPDSAIAATRDAIGNPCRNSYLPFVGQPELRAAVAKRLLAQTGRPYDPDGEVVVTSGGMAGLLSVMLALVSPGNEALLTDPMYPGLANRIRMAGGQPRQVPLTVDNGRWRLDLDLLAAAVGPATRFVVLVNPAMPSGLVLTRSEWAAVAEICDRHDLRLIYDAALENIVFDDIQPLHPAALPMLASRTIIVGSPSKEFRMIGWRVGWIAAPRSMMGAITNSVVNNTLVASGFAQAGVTAALSDPDPGVTAAVAEWQRRRDLVVQQLGDLRLVIPEGGWSILLDAQAHGSGAETMSERLLRLGRVAATPMTTWGDRLAPRYLRLIYSREPLHRLASLRERFARAL